MRYELRTPKAGIGLTIMCFFVPIIVAVFAVSACKLKNYIDYRKKKQLEKQLLEKH